MRFVLTLLLALILTTSLIARADELEELLDTKGRKTTWQYLRERSAYFIEPRLQNGDLVWLQGTMESADGRVFKGLNVNFNTLDNSLYLRHAKGLFKLPANALSRFTIQRDGEKLVFEKDFKLFSEQEIQMTSTCGLEKALLHLLSEETTDHRLLSVSATSTDNGEHFISLQLATSGTKTIYELQRHLMGSQCLSAVTLLSEIPEIDETRFMQVLATNEEIHLLKLHTNRAGTTESVSLTGHKGSRSLTDERYFLADGQQRITEIRKIRASVRKALELMDITVNQDLPNLNTEKRLVRWFEAATL